MRRLRALLPRLSHALPWRAIGFAAAIAVAVAHASGGTVPGLRGAALALCAAAVYALDDAAGETVGASPTSRFYRRLVRLGLVVPVVVLSWPIALSAAEGAARVGLTLELAAMLSLMLAVTAVINRVRGDELGGIEGAAATLLVLASASLLLPGRWTLFAGGPYDPSWGASHIRWTALLLLGALLFAHLSRHARPHLASRLRSRGATIARVNRLGARLRQAGR